MYCSIDEAWNITNNNNKSNNILNNSNSDLDLDHDIESDNNIINDFKLYLKLKKQSNKFNKSNFNTNINENFISSKNDINNDSDFKNNKGHLHTLINDDNILIPNINLKHDDNLFNKINTHDDILNHVYNCELCYKKLFNKPHGLGINLSLITKENKDIISIVLIGLLVILILNLFINK